LKEDTHLCRKGDQYATMNKTTTICCPVRGFPPPEVTWKLPNGTKLTTGNTMLPITPEKADFGNYTCSAVNVGTVKGPFVISLKQEGRRTFLAEIVDTSGVTELKPGEN
ncbi:Immunoglobulin super member 10, partial [Desmophyllum pertusum]